RFVDRGMLPNRFPDGGQAPEYNTADATLWYVEAIRAYHAATGDDGLLKDLYPMLESILAWHRDGTRYGIRQDPADRLLAADGPDGNETALRPNQILAVSLPASALPPARRRAVVDACARHLLTSYGLRSLAPFDARYVGRYGGDQRARDGAYHQGTAWGWLLGPFALAHFNAYGDAARAREYLAPLADHLGDYGLGSIAEIFDGAAPFLPLGCIAQAWSVAETLRAWQALGAPAPARR